MSGVSATLGAAEGARGVPYVRLAAARLRNQSNDSAAERRDGGAPTGGVAIANGAVGCSETACRRNGEDAAGEPLADCGTRRYSAESTAEALAATVTHPASDAGSIDVYAPTASTTWVASAELHAGVAGPASLPQPAVAARDHRTTCTALRRFITLASA